MNIHPLFVHFPIALLALYSLLEISTYFCARLRTKSWLLPVKTFLLFVGALSTLLALASGGMAEELVRGVSSRVHILELHEPFALATTLLYFALAATYLNRWFDQSGWGARIAGSNRFLLSSWEMKKYLTNLLLESWMLPLLAFIALGCLLITGALGAAIVYGPNADPLVALVYHLFWK